MFISTVKRSFVYRFLFISSAIEGCASVDKKLATYTALRFKKKNNFI